MYQANGNPIAQTGVMIDTFTLPARGWIRGAYNYYNQEDMDSVSYSYVTANNKDHPHLYDPNHLWTAADRNGVYSEATFALITAKLPIGGRFGIAAEGEALATSKFVPNPFGKLGGPAHQGVVADITANIEARGLIPFPEFRILTPGGARSARYVDVVGLDPVTKLPVEYYQVGKQTLAGNPISREAQAIRDIQQVTNRPVTFQPYNIPGK